jgi:hypothetical protein
MLDTAVTLQRAFHTANRSVSRNSPSTGAKPNAFSMKLASIHLEHWPIFQYNPQPKLGNE